MKTKPKLINFFQMAMLIVDKTTLIGHCGLFVLSLYNNASYTRVICNTYA
jgi:hypothetical protein